MQKSYTVKIYSLAGVYIKTANPLQITNEVRFSSKINGFQGQCVIELALPIDDFDEGASIKLMNIVRIYEADDVNSPAPRLIYTGFISQYTPFFDEGAEGVRLTLLGLGSLLSYTHYKNGSSYTVAKAGVDPAAIMREVIDQFNAAYTGSLMGYTGSTVVDTGTNITYTFTDAKWFDAIKKSFELGGGGRYWKLAEDGQLYFKLKPSTATHRFTIGDDVQSGEVVKNSEQVVNVVQLRWGGTPTVANYSDATSITNYGRRESVITDASIGNSTSADQIGNGQIADSKDSKVQARLRINTKYDIETIKVGDTCSVFNVKNGSTVFPANMQITALTYSPDFVDVELENVKSTFADNFNSAVQAIA